jgi:hypothetical protein
MLAVAGVVTWLGYAAFTYGLSQTDGQNYGLLDLIVPGKFTLGNPAPDPPATATTKVTGGNTTQTGSTVEGPVSMKGSYATRADCQSKSGKSCLQIKGRWFPFTGQIASKL